MTAIAENSRPIPQGWHMTHAPQGIEISYFPREGRGFIAAFIFNSIVTALSGYGVYGFLKNWFIDKAEILTGGFVLCLVLVGGILFGVRNFKILFERISYTFGGSTLIVFRKKPLAAAKKVIIERGSTRKIIRLYTPPKQRGESDTFRTCLVYSGSAGKDFELFFEGCSKDESDFLIEVISEWAPSIEHENQNTVE